MTADLERMRKGEGGMGMILTGIVVSIAIAIGAGYFLLSAQQQQPAWQVYSSESTRVGDPGHNLVGQNWTGENSAAAGGEKTPS